MPPHSKQHLLTQHPSVRQGLGQLPAEPCCQFLNAHPPPPPPPASTPRKPPGLPHMLLSRNNEIQPVQGGETRPGSATWAGWKQPAPPGEKGGYGTVCPPLPAPQLTPCLHPEAAAASSPAGKQLPPDRAHRKPRGIYRALRELCTNSGKNLHSVTNNLLTQSCTGSWCLGRCSQHSSGPTGPGRWL